MNIEGLDPQLVRRLVRRIGAYLDEGAVSEDSLRQVFEMFNADEPHQLAVRQALKATGITVRRVPTVEDVDNSAPPKPVPGPAVPSVPARIAQSMPPGRSLPKAAANRRTPRSAVDEARALLDEDRLNSRPWKRLLTASEEVGLATLMRTDGVPLSQALPKGFRRTLSDEDERARAFDAMMLHNRGLVWSLVKRYVGHGLEAEDLEQSGYTGLRRAVEMFDASQGWKFSTYATNWINQAMSRAVADEGRLVRLPVYMHERVQKVLAIRERMLIERGRARLFDLAAASDLRPDQVLECLRLASGVVSLDAPLGDDGTTLEALLDEERHALPDPAAVVMAMEIRDEILEVVDLLADRESRIIRLRFGLENDEPQTLDQVGRHFGLTRERIRQIEAKAKKRLGFDLHSRGFGPPIWPPVDVESA